MFNAMILAAGLGSRLQPLTQHTPKPLLQIRGIPLIEYHLTALARCGVAKVVINLHHLGEHIRQQLGDGKKFGLEIIYSEETTLLGTAGGIRHALQHLGPEPFLLISSDIFTDFPFESLAEQPQIHASSAHLILVENPTWYPQGDFYLVDHQLACTTPSPLIVDNPMHNTRYTYANIGIFHPQLFAHLPEGHPHALGTLLKHVITQTTECVSGELYHGLWTNVGSMETLAEAQQLANCISSPLCY